MRVQPPQPFGRAAALALLALTLAGCQSLVPLLPDCPRGQSLGADKLEGRWRLEMTGTTTPWSLDLGPHPEHIGSLSGQLWDGQRQHAVVADLDGREFTMEESHDGQRIDATWLGTAVPGHCGRLVRGERLATDGSSQGFTMRPAR